MQLDVTPNAIDWFRREMKVSEGDSVRFFVRLGGCGSTQSGFSLGVDVEPARNPDLVLDREGVRFYMEKEDTWYLDQRSLRVDVEGQSGELTFVIE
jgi:uncharacterized protein YneR